MPTGSRIKGSPQQVAIWQNLRDGRNHVIVKALAGTGKTTTCVEGMKWLTESERRDCVFVAFNKPVQLHIVEQLRLAGLLEQGAQGLTSHGLGLRALNKGLGGVVVDLDKLQKQMPDGISREVRLLVTKLVGLCKANLLDGTNEAELDALCIQYNLEIATEKKLVFGIVAAMMRLSLENIQTVDFDDMVWLPVMLARQGRVKPWKHRVLFVDESQDLNRAQIELMLLCGLRIVLVGDENQAIYAFRGADSNAMALMESMLSHDRRGLKVFPLTVSRRCPISVAILARHIVPGFDAMPDAPIGQVIRKNQPDMKLGDMVLCRTNAPLLGAAMGLIRQRVPVRVLGTDIGKQLSKFVLSLADRDIVTSEMLVRLERYRAAQTTIIMADETKVMSNERKLQSLNDKCDCIGALAEGTNQVAEIIDRIESLFAEVKDTDPSTCVIFSSVHKAKGLEADTVHILHEELMPHPMARQPWEKKQENNLKYVAVTRAKNTLVFR